MINLDTSHIRRSLGEASRRLERGVTYALDAATREAADVARAGAPGKIPQTIGVSSPSPDVRRLSSSWHGAIWHENGTAPHPIAPKNRKVLRFVVNGSSSFHGASLGSYVYTRLVHHPGTRALHFMRHGVEAGRVAMRAELGQLMRGLFL